MGDSHTNNLGSELWLRLLKHLKRFMLIPRMPYYIDNVIQIIGNSARGLNHCFDEQKRIMRIMYVIAMNHL